MSNVQECLDLYLADEFVTDAQFRRFMAEAEALDSIERAATVTYWRNLGEVRAERQRMEREGA